MTWGVRTVFVLRPSWQQGTRYLCTATIMAARDKVSLYCDHHGSKGQGIFVLRPSWQQGTRYLCTATIMAEGDKVSLE